MAYHRHLPLFIRDLMLARGCRLIACAQPVTRCSSPLWLRTPNASGSHRALQHQGHDRSQVADSSSATSGASGTSNESRFQDFKRALNLPPANCSLKQIAGNQEYWMDKEVTVHGYLGTRRDASKTLTFAELHDTSLNVMIQLISTLTKGVEGSDSPYSVLRSLGNHSPVAVSGTLKARGAPATNPEHRKAGPMMIAALELKVEGLVPLNEFPGDIMMHQSTVMPPERRHLQIRNTPGLRSALGFRSAAAQVIRDELCSKHGFIEVETPLLFKSTPEGAREFLVPSRTRNKAYALPQSPQQYKQILMSSGIPRYMQIAKCFRDEDLRADRQPEFTQVDMEMAFASGEMVMQTMEALIRRLWKDMLSVDDLPNPFPRMSYQDAMAKYGSDKPDLRLGSEIHRIDYMLPVDLISKIGPLNDPIVEVLKVAVSGDAGQTREFVSTFMDSPDAQPFVQNPEGQPGIFIFDSRQPLQGLMPFGFEAAEHVEKELDLQDGDLVVLQARSNLPFSGGATALGNLRLALHRAAVGHGLLPAPQGLSFTWVVDFPLFSPSVKTEPGQGGSAGISATHHPFTAPKTPEDVDLLATVPLQAKADHYDLVMNGVELGGGSRRIHNASFQKYIMKDILKMDDERIKDFAGLLEALRTGCPPHAGIALGFDRLIAAMLGKSSVKEVIAFPKSGKGADVMVGSPSLWTQKQLFTYHLRPKFINKARKAARTVNPPVRFYES